MQHQPLHQSAEPTVMLRMPQLCGIVGLSRASIYNLVKAGTFPRQRRLSPRCVAWRADEVQAWLDTRDYPAPALVAESKRQPNGNRYP